jgi:hypothetical protein
VDFFLPETRRRRHGGAHRQGSSDYKARVRLQADCAQWRPACRRKPKESRGGRGRRGSALAYFKNNRSRQYGSSGKGFFIGPGGRQLPDGHQTVQAIRMRWSEAGAENILALRCIPPAVAPPTSGSTASTATSPATLPALAA